MRGRRIPWVTELDGHRFEETTLDYLEDGRAQYWTIDVSTVLWMLERIAEGDTDAVTAQDHLRQATSWDSDCCGDCDNALPYYEEARRAHKELVQRWEQQQAQLDSADYPYISNKGKIHTIDCRHPSMPSPPWFPNTLHGFGKLFERNGSVLEDVFKDIEGLFPRGPQRISASDVRSKIVRNGVRAVESKLCRTCKPHLPQLDPDATELRPACWTWPTDTETLDRLREIAESLPVSDENILPKEQNAFELLKQWQDRRCAVCGERPAKGRLVRDHDHTSGLIRGLLCYRCNTTEARSTSPLFSNYRKRPPSAMVAVKVLYLPPGFRPGSEHFPPETP